MSEHEPGFSRRELIKAGAALAIGSIGQGPQVAAAAGSASARSVRQRGLLVADLSRSLDVRNLAKPVHTRLLLDDMEASTPWQATPAVQLSYTTERARSGTRSLRASILLRDAELIRDGRQPNGTFDGNAILFEVHPRAALLTRVFDPPQDWSAYNRISLWCYVHPGNPLNAFALEFLCEGAGAGPNDPVAVNYIGDLKPGEWNQIVWEIPEYQRDRVVSLHVFQPRWGLPIAGSGPALTYDFDLLELHQVDAEAVEGWAVAPGHIAFSHAGYRTDGAKVALAAASSDPQFELLNDAGHVAATFDAAAVSNRRGQWRRLEFSRFDRPGTYRIRYASTVSEPFVIAAAPWRPVAEATLNAFYGLRCGCAIPGVHDACHEDVFVDYQGRRVCLAGGWHDAGNLTQNANNTHLSIVGLVALMQAGHENGDAALADRAAEEARWGLDWSLRLRLAPGVRAASVPASFYTDSRVGTDDDVIFEATRVVRQDAFTNILAVLAYASAARTFKKRDPVFARELQAAAVADYQSGFPGFEVDGRVPSGMNQGSTADMAGYAALAAVELFRLTGSASYRDAAARFGRAVCDTQEPRFVSGIPVAGYFYEDTHRERLTHEFHSSFEEGRLLALEALCETFPSHADWMDWYAGLLIYSEYFCAQGSEASAPFDVLPAAVWRRADIERDIPPDRAAAMLASKPNPLFPSMPGVELVRLHMRQQFEAAADLGADQRLRVFPLWFDHVRHGATVVQLTKAIGLAAAARVRGRRPLHELAERQLQWTLGCNPFSRSLMYGVGYDWWQNFTVEVPNLVGGLAVGMNSYSQDSPAWGNNAVFPYKEIWVLALSRAASLLARLMLPPQARVVTGEPGAMVRDGAVELTLGAAGPVRKVELRCSNLEGGTRTLQVGERGLTERLRVSDASRPWVIVLLPEGDFAARQELYGTAQPLPSIT